MCAAPALEDACDFQLYRLTCCLCPQMLRMLFRHPSMLHPAAPPHLRKGGQWLVGAKHNEVAVQVLHNDLHMQMKGIIKGKGQKRSV